MLNYTTNTESAIRLPWMSLASWMIEIYDNDKLYIIHIIYYYSVLHKQISNMSLNKLHMYE